MAVILKIPIAFMIGIVWWALKQEPTIEVEPDDGGEYRRRRANAPRPRDPRRGPGEVLPRPQTEGRVRTHSPAAPDRVGRRVTDQL